MPRRCDRLLPTRDQEGGPSRRTVFVDKDGIDVRAPDLAAELRWFAESYGDRLADLAGGFGEPPAVRWGGLSWRA